MKQSVHRFRWNESTKDLRCESTDALPAELKILSESINTIILSKSGIKRMESWKIGLLISSFILLSLAVAFVAILHKWSVLGVVFLVFGPFTSYIFLSIVANKKRRMTAIQSFLDTNSQTIESEGAKAGFMIDVRVQYVQLDPSPKFTLFCCKKQKEIEMTIEYAAKNTSMQTTKAIQTQEDSHSGAKCPSGMNTKPLTVNDTPIAETNLIRDKPALEMDSKGSSSKNKRKSDSGEEDDMVSDRNLLVSSKGSPNRMKPSSPSIHHQIIKDISKRSASHGVFVVSNLGPTTEVVRVRPKNLAFGIKPQRITPKIFGLDYGLNKPSLSQNNVKAGNSISKTVLRSQAKPRGKTFITTGILF